MSEQRTSVPDWWGPPERDHQPGDTLPDGRVIVDVTGEPVWRFICDLLARESPGSIWRALEPAYAEKPDDPGGAGNPMVLPQKA